MVDLITKISRLIYSVSPDQNPAVLKERLALVKEQLKSILKDVATLQQENASLKEQLNQAKRQLDAPSTTAQSPKSHVVHFKPKSTGSNIVPTEYSCKTKIGTFIIRPEHNHPGRWRLWIDDYLLGEYPSPEAAADDVYKQSTGFKKWDSLSLVSEPTDLSKWKKIFSK